MKTLAPNQQIQPGDRWKMSHWPHPGFVETSETPAVGRTVQEARGFYAGHYASLTQSQWVRPETKEERLAWAVWDASPPGLRSQPGTARHPAIINRRTGDELPLQTQSLTDLQTLLARARGGAQ